MAKNDKFSHFSESADNSADKMDILNQSLATFKNLMTFNRSDSPVFSNLCWLIGILNEYIENPDSITVVQEFKKYVPTASFKYKELTSEDYEGAPLTLIVNARTAFTAVKRVIH